MIVHAGSHDRQMKNLESSLNFFFFSPLLISMGAHVKEKKNLQLLQNARH